MNTKEVTLYNHAYTIAFTVETAHKDDDVTPMELLQGLLDRVNSILREELSGNHEILEATGGAYDTYEIEPGMKTKEEIEIIINQSRRTLCRKTK